MGKILPTHLFNPGMGKPRENCVTLHLINLKFCKTKNEKRKQGSGGWERKKSKLRLNSLVVILETYDWTRTWRQYLNQDSRGRNHGSGTARSSKPKTIVSGKLDFVYISFKQIVIILTFKFENYPHILIFKWDIWIQKKR